MKFKTKILLVALISNASLALTTTALAQGLLTPPGPPLPTMKTLDQVQPCTPIGNGNFYITISGSYYVATNLLGFSGLNCITVEADNVTIDLKGFTLQGVSGSEDGIYISGSHTNIIILNGIISGWSHDGLDGGLSSQNLIVEHLTVSGNMVNGIAANNCIISDCSIQNNQWNGITVSGDGSQITRNILSGNNSANHANGASIWIASNNNLIEDNFVTGTGGLNGITLTGDVSDNIIIRNSVIGWGVGDYLIPEYNDLGPTGAASASTSPWANIAH